MKKQIPPVEFNTIFNKIELGSSIERLQDVIDILWAAEESLLEDDLVEICGIPVDEWLNIRNSFGESVLLEDGRVGYLNSQMRKAVESKYIATQTHRRRVYKRLATRCAELMGQGRNNLGEHVRRHAVRYFLQAGAWDDAHKSLCIWNMKTGKLQKAFPSNTWHYSSFAISPDGQMIMCRGRDNKLTIIEIKIGEVHSFHFYGITTSAVDWARRRVSIGFSDGRVEFYDLQGIEVKPFITTAVREIVPPDIDSSPVKARPVCCKQEITIPKPISERIRDWTEKEGSGGYKDPALVLHCPHCGTLLRMNPFFVDVTTSM